MNYVYDIPSSFWGLFRSVNRDIYMEALLVINEEYQYNNYFLSREYCIQLLADMCTERKFSYEKEETETEDEAKEILPRRILHWLIQSRWLRKIEDYSTMATNIVIPDYAAIFIDAFEQLVHKPEDDTEIYIQNVYATLFSFQNDPRMNIAMLKTALVNTKKLNKVLQDMLHNMDRFFERLLMKQSYGELLKEHLEGYVEEIVKKKYHILKTSDNFYIYKMDIKNCLREMREDELKIERIRRRQEQLKQERGQKGLDDKENSPIFGYRSKDDDVVSLLDQIERGFDDIEHRIANMDREHSKYIRATVSRLQYLLSDEGDRRGLIIQLLNHLGEQEDGSYQESRITQVAGRMNLSSFDVLHENPLYKRKNRMAFKETLEAEAQDAELSKEEILRLNHIQHRFSKQQIEAFIEEHMEGNAFHTGALELTKDEDFEKLILAYDLVMRKDSRYRMITEDKQLERGKYKIPSMMFVRKEV